MPLSKNSFLKIGTNSFLAFGGGFPLSIAIACAGVVTPQKILVKMSDNNVFLLLRITPSPMLINISIASGEGLSLPILNNEFQGINVPRPYNGTPSLIKVNITG